MNNFSPDWVSCPGDTIKDVMVRKALMESDLFNLLELNVEVGTSLLCGQHRIDYSLAEKLSHALGASPKFWLKRQENFEIQTKQIEQEMSNWVASLPVSDLIKNGILTTRTKLDVRFNECLSFFGVRNLKEWDTKYNKLLSAASFRTSQSFDSTPTSVITWLRQGEIQASRIECDNWSRDELRNCIPQIRKLSRISDAEEMLASLVNVLAKCGVALAIVRCPRGCRASGATYFLSENKAMIILSFRYLSDDHFWFSLFHEIGHLLLHDKKGIFLEGLDKTTDVQEQEANDFSTEVLIPAAYETKLMSLKASRWRDIIRFAKSIEISPGIVVGQLQHRQVISYRDLNKLKIRYQWK